MNKLFLAAAAVSILFIVQPAFAGYICEVRDYSPGLTGAKGNRRQALDIIKSWIPEAFILHEDRLQFGDDFSIEVDSYTSQKVRASYQTKDSKGKRHYVVYEVVFRQDNTIANVTMQQNRYKPLGPVIFDCKET